MTMDVMELMASWPTVSRYEHGALVHTHCMLPSGSTVNVFVQPTIDGFVATDHGAAFSDARSSGVVPDDHIRSVRSKVEARGLRLDGGQIWSPKVNRDEVPMAAILVANAAKEVAEYLVTEDRRPGRTDIAELLPRLLMSQWGSRVVKEGLSLRGKSAKLYTFRNVIELPAGTKAIFDPVSHNANSINARVVVNLDVQGAHLEGINPHIVYDDRDAWRPEEISLLKTAGAKTVPFSQTHKYLARLAA